MVTLTTSNQRKPVLFKDKFYEAACVYPSLKSIPLNIWRYVDRIIIDWEIGFPSKCRRSPVVVIRRRSETVLSYQRRIIQEIEWIRSVGSVMKIRAFYLVEYV